MHKGDAVMEVLEQSAVSAEVRLSETEATVLALAMRYWRDAMDANSPIVEGLSERLQQITEDFDSVMASVEAE